MIIPLMTADDLRSTGDCLYNFEKYLEHQLKQILLPLVNIFISI